MSAILVLNTIEPRREAIRAAGRAAIEAHRAGNQTEVDRLLKEERRLIEEFRRDYPEQDLSRERN